MYIVGFTGPINHGKTTAAKMLRSLEPDSKHIESWEIIAEVAAALNKQFDPEVVDQRDATSINTWLFHLLDVLPGVLNLRPTFDQMEVRESEIEQNPAQYNKLFIYIDRLKDNPDMAKEEITDDNKEDHRPLLQWLGGYLPQCLGETIWFDEIMKRVLSHKEDRKLHTISGLRYPADAAAVRKHGGAIVEIQRPSYAVAEQTDPTEMSRKFIDPDTVLVNNGGLGDLEEAIHALWTDTLASRVRFKYESVS